MTDRLLHDHVLFLSSVVRVLPDDQFSKVNEAHEHHPLLSKLNGLGLGNRGSGIGSEVVVHGGNEAG